MKLENTTSNPYLTFAGNCREAMTFYKEIVDGELELMTFETAPMELPEGYKTKIMHSTLKFGDAIVMAADAMPGQEIVHGNGSSVIISSPSVENAQKIFTQLAEGGQTQMPFEKTFWGSMFGQCTDKFGINWMLISEHS